MRKCGVVEEANDVEDDTEERRRRLASRIRDGVGGWSAVGLNLGLAQNKEKRGAPQEEGQSRRIHPAVTVVRDGWGNWGRRV